MDETLSSSSWITLFSETLRESSWTTIIVTIICVVTINATFQSLFRPKNYPPFYYEFPYIPLLGSIVQFAYQPREFLQRANEKCGNVFTIKLFGRNMTFLFGTSGHAHFFRAPEHVFDIREAYAMTVTTFGPGVCYDVPQSKSKPEKVRRDENISVAFIGFDLRINWYSYF